MAFGPNESVSASRRRRPVSRPSESAAFWVPRTRELLETILQQLSPPSQPALQRPTGACVLSLGVEPQRALSLRPRVQRRGVSGRDPSFLYPLPDPASLSPRWP